MCLFKIVMFVGVTLGGRKKARVGISGEEKVE